VRAEAGVGQPLRLSVTAAGLAPFECVSPEPLAEATKHPLTVELL